MDAGHNGSLGRKRDAKTFCFRCADPSGCRCKVEFHAASNHLRDAPVHYVSSRGTETTWRSAQEAIVNSKVRIARTGALLLTWAFILTYAETTAEIRVTRQTDNQSLANVSVELSKPGPKVVIQRSAMRREWFEFRLSMLVTTIESLGRRVLYGHLSTCSRAKASL
jgi:hypothetical protein